MHRDWRCDNKDILWRSNIARRLWQYGRTGVLVSLDGRDSIVRSLNWCQVHLVRCGSLPVYSVLDELGHFPYSSTPVRVSGVMRSSHKFAFKKTASLTAGNDLFGAHRDDTFSHYFFADLVSQMRGVANHLSALLLAKCI